MSSQHGEETLPCNQCFLEKETNDGALTTTEDGAAPATEDVAPSTTKRVITKKTMTPRLKRILVLVNSSLLVSAGAAWYLNTKLCLKLATDTFDTILDLISRRTE